MRNFHHDTVAQNFLISGKKGYLIDFEWASLDYPESDFVSFLSPFAAAWSNQRISSKAARQFISSYCRAKGFEVGKVKARVASARPFVQFTHLSWVARILLSHAHKTRLSAREKAEAAYARRCLRLLEKKK